MMDSDEVADVSAIRNFVPEIVVPIHHGTPPGIVFFTGNNNYFSRVEFALAAIEDYFLDVAAYNRGSGTTRPTGSACWKPNYGYCVQLRSEEHTSELQSRQ